MNWLTSRGAPLVALAALVLTGCDKGTALSVDLPNTTAVNTAYQDLPVDVSTINLAPVQTLKTDHYLVGRVVDNVAGTTEARAFLNTVVSSTLISANDTLPASFTQPALDSVVMIMGFDKVYGSATQPVAFDVFKLQTPLDERQVYDASTATPLGAALGQNLTSRLDRTQQQTITAAVAATTTAGGTAAVTTTVPDQTVRLLLQRTAVAAVPPTASTPAQPAVPGVPLQFANDLFTQISITSFGQPQLDALLAGLAVVPSAGYNSGVVSFGRGYGSRMVVYFHSADLRSHRYSVYFGPVFSTLGLPPAHDPRYYTQILNTLPSPLAVLSSPAGFVPSTVLGGTSYVQAGTGLATRVTFTGLTTLMNTPGLIVNRAELRVPVKPYTNALFPSPGRLYAVEVDGNNTVLQRIVNYATYDRVVQANGFDPLGTGNGAFGTLTDPSTSLGYYSIPVTTYIQAYLTNNLGGNPVSLVLAPNIRSSAALGLNRAALDASNITLRVYYSKK